jgi:hypothetical protein
LSADTDIYPHPVDWHHKPPLATLYTKAQKQNVKWQKSRQKENEKRSGMEEGIGDRWDRGVEDRSRGQK